jgi:predicted NBD/HSP70 family sugar kinase
VDAGFDLAHHLAMRALGIDVGGTSVKMALIESAESSHIGSGGGGTKAIWLGQSSFYAKPDAARLREAMREAQTGAIGRVDAVGICVPGILNEARDTVTLSINVPGLMNLPLAELVESALGPEARGAKVQNDALSCATDVIEMFDLDGRTMLLALGTGVGAGVIDRLADGGLRPLEVSGASPGHIGMIDVTCDDPPTIGPDGGAGSLEGYLGVPALRKRFGVDINPSLANLPADDVVIKALSRAIRIGHAMYRPNHVVLAGGVGVRLSPHLDVLRKRVETHLTSVARPGWTLRTAADDHHAARGAARRALEGKS